MKLLYGCRCNDLFCTEGGRREGMVIDWVRENGKGDLQESTSPATTTSTVLGPRKGGQLTNEGNLTSTGSNLNLYKVNVNGKKKHWENERKGDESSQESLNPSRSPQAVLGPKQSGHTSYKSINPKEGNVN